MTQTKTKKALLMSVLSMVLCVAMLVGMTFAWFTDTASTGVNKIQAGTLKVDIVDKEGRSLKGEILKFSDVNGNTNILWEPGATFNLTPFKIVNKGNLALKYKVVINGIDGNAGLLKAIDFTLKEGDETTESPLAGWEGKLLPADSTLDVAGAEKGETALYRISGHMKEEAGNEYQGKELNGISITVYATQLEAEYDSYGTTYDEEATYPVGSESALKEALTAGGIVSVTENIETNGEDTADARIAITEPTILNLEKKIISPDNMGNNSTNFVALIVDANTTINAGANGGIDTGENGGYALNVRKGATLTINSGTYYGGGTAVQVQKGSLVINGGFFAVEPFGDPYGYGFLLNCLDSAYKDGTAKITVKGGTFVNFDPSNNAAEGAGTNFVAEGYKVVSETQSNGDIWYTVVAK